MFKANFAGNLHFVDAHSKRLKLLTLELVIRYTMALSFGYGVKVTYPPLISPSSWGARLLGVRFPVSESFYLRDGPIPC